MPDTPTLTRPQLSRSPTCTATDGLLSGPAARLALALALLLPACGGDEAPSPEPEGRAAPEAAAGEPAESTAATPTGGARKRYDIPVRVTPAPAGSPPDAPALLRGVARLDGPIPKRNPIAMNHIAGCRDHEPALVETVIATEEGELQNVVVYVARGLDREAVPPAPDEPAVLLQEDCVFHPHVLVVRAGQTLQIHNADKTNHNVNARPTHGSNTGFNKMQPPGAGDLEQVFPRAEVAIPIGCDVHPWMKAWVAVVDSPYYSVSGEDGAWSIELPPGDYLVEAWHERYGTLKGTVELAAGEVGQFDFSFAPAKKRN